MHFKLKHAPLPEFYSPPLPPVPPRGVTFDIIDFAESYYGMTVLKSRDAPHYMARQSRRATASPAHHSRRTLDDNTLHYCFTRLPSIEYANTMISAAMGFAVAVYFSFISHLLSVIDI